MSCYLGGRCINPGYSNCDICCIGARNRTNEEKSIWQKTKIIQEERLKSFKDGLLVECLRFVGVPDGEQTCPLFHSNDIYMIRDYDEGQFVVSSTNGTSYLPSEKRKGSTWEDFDKTFRIVTTEDVFKKIGPITVYCSGKMICWCESECLFKKQEYKSCNGCERIQLIKKDDLGYWVDRKELDQLCKKVREPVSI